MDEALQGRMLLWLGILGEVRMLLTTRKRIEDVKPGIAAKLANGATGAVRGDVGDFPHFGDCTVLSDACIGLSIVYFCQLLTRGDEAKPTTIDDHAVAENSKAVRPLVLHAVSSQTGDPKAVELANQMCSDLVKARNGMLAHADGTFFDLKKIASNSGSVGTKQNMTSLAWKKINPDELLWLVNTVEQWIYSELNPKMVVKV